jgi:hypothetical protein
MEQAIAAPNRLWHRLVFVIVTAGVVYLSLQGADLWALQSLARSAEAGEAFGRTLAPVAYVPLAAQTADATSTTTDPADFKLAEIGDGGDLAKRARRVLDRYRPCLMVQRKDDLACVALGPLLEALGGELQWSEGAPQAKIILPQALITLRLDKPVALRNFREIALSAPPVADFGQLRIAVRDLPELLGATLTRKTPDSPDQITLGDHHTYLVTREEMYHMEACRSGCWLQVYFLGQPVKRYPICAGKGNNTPLGHFHIKNKAVWPPWNAYWGEYMPGGSSRNPLGARWLGTSAAGRETGRVIGIHGTNQPNSIGRRISGGCMRTYNNFAIELYNNIPVGTPLDIHE